MPGGQFASNLPMREALQAAALTWHSRTIIPSQCCDDCANFVTSENFGLGVVSSDGQSKSVDTPHVSSTTAHARLTIFIRAGPPTIMVGCSTGRNRSLSALCRYQLNLSSQNADDRWMDLWRSAEHSRSLMVAPSAAPPMPQASTGAQSSDCVGATEASAK